MGERLQSPCNTCGGSGQVRHTLADVPGGTPADDVRDEQTKVCPDCEGTGKRIVTEGPVQVDPERPEGPPEQSPIEAGVPTSKSPETAGTVADTTAEHSAPERPQEGVDVSEVTPEPGSVLADPDDAAPGEVTPRPDTGPETGVEEGVPGPAGPGTTAPTGEGETPAAPVDSEVEGGTAATVSTTPTEPVATAADDTI